MAHTIIAAKKTKILNRVILTTDSKLYAKIGMKFRSRGFHFIRPKKLATDKAHHPDVVKHAVQFVEKDKVKFDYVVMLQPTSPFRKSKHINEAIKKFLKENNDSLISIKKHDYPLGSFFI